MAKNVGNVYVPIFSKNLKRLFLDNFVALQDDKMKRSFLKVLQTWRFVFDRSLIRSIEGEIFGSSIPDNYSAIPPESLTTMKQMIGTPSTQEPIPPSTTASVPAFSLEALDQSAALLASLKALNIPIVNPLAEQPPLGVTKQPAPEINGHAPIPSREAASLPGIKRKEPSTSSRVSRSEEPHRPTERPSERQPVRSQPSASRTQTKTRQISSNSPLKIEISTEFINQKYPNAHSILYNALKLACKNCGLRFHDSSSSRQRLAIHLDWHFRRNRRIKERFKKPISRDWFPTEKVRIY